MKKLIILLFFISFTINLTAQIRLDVEGDAKIQGKLELIQTFGDAGAGITVSEASAPTFRMERSGTGRFDYEMYMNSADLRFRGGANGTGGILTDFVTFSGSGNVGIGTTSPSQLLTISNNNSPTFRMERSGAGRSDFEMYMNSADLRFRGGTDGTGGTLTDFVTFAGTGNVGIGTTAPQAKLDVNGGLISGAISINGNELGDDKRINFRASDNSNRFQIETDLDPFVDNDLLGFRSFQEDNILVLKGNGNVGIGTTNPVEKLHVNGNVTIPEGRLFLNRGVRNVHIGKNVGSSTIGKESVIIGENANNANTGQAAHVYIGYNAGTNSTSGAQNVGVGLNVSTGTTTGIANVHVGGFTGSNANGSFQTFVGYNVNSFAGETTNENSFAIGSNLTVTSANSGVLGNASLIKVGGSVNWSSVSDLRFKRKIKENVNGLDFIMALRPVTYQVDVEKLHNFTSNSDASARSKPDASAVKVVKMLPSLKKALAEKSKITYSGFLAQEVEAAAKKIGYDFSGVVKPSNEQDPYGLRYAEFTVPLVKATQEQQALIQAQEQKINKQELAIANQNKKIEGLENKLVQLSTLVEKLRAPTEENPQGGNYGLHLKKAPALLQNQPNPFNENTQVTYFIPETAKNAFIQVTTVDGKVLGKVNIQEKGNGQVTIKATTYPTGIYYYSLVVDGEVFETKRMVLSR